MTELRGEDLLLFLDALVRADAALPGFRGRLAVAVEREGNALWWIATFTERASTDFSDQPPESFDACMRLDPVAANQFMGREVPGKAAAPKIEGNKKLIAKFVERYVEQRSMLDIRTGR
jgi:hypothetical protein